LSLFVHEPFSGYLHHWSLQRPAFLSCPDFFFSGQPQRETLAALQYFAASDWKLAILTAASRSGVSHLLDHLVSMRGFGSCPVDVILTRTTGDSSTSLMQKLGSVLGHGQRNEITLPMIDAAIQQSDKQGIRTLWFLENCPASTIGVAAEFAQRHRNFSVVATTLPDDRPRLQLNAGMCGMQIELDSLPPQDTQAYVAAALKQAGSTSAIFSEAAITRLHDMSAGLIGEIAVLAELALTTSACSGLSRITPGVIEQVAESYNMQRLTHPPTNDGLLGKRVA
jgi:hypothetical protein